MELIENIPQLIFYKVLLNAIFPTSVILLCFAFFNFKVFKRNPQLGFVLITLVVVAGVRLIFGFTNREGWNYESRRFYCLAAICILFAVVGFPVLVSVSKSLIDKIYKKRSLSLGQLTVFWILVIGLVCIGKGLSLPSYKKYVHEPGKIIKSNTPKDKKSLFVYESLNNNRNTYYSKADKSIHLDTVLNRNKPEYFYDALNVLHEKGYKTYIFIDQSGPGFKKLFTDKGVEFKLKLLKQWKDGDYTLYEYNEKI